MNVKDAISKLKVMLSADTETVDTTDVTESFEEKEKETETKMATAELVDGTKVQTEGALEVGATLFVIPGEDEQPIAAPEGTHETTEGVIVQVGDAGEIIAIDEVAETEAKEEDKEGEMAKDDKETEQFVSAVADLLKPQIEEIKTLKEQLSTLQERFNKVADEPAASKVKNTFSEEAQVAKNKAEARFERLMKIRKGDI